MTIPLEERSGWRVSRSRARTRLSGAWRPPNSQLQHAGGRTAWGQEHRPLPTALVPLPRTEAGSHVTQQEGGIRHLVRGKWPVNPESTVEPSKPMWHGTNGQCHGMSAWCPHPRLSLYAHTCCSSCVCSCCSCCICSRRSTFAVLSAMAVISTDCCISCNCCA